VNKPRVMAIDWSGRSGPDQRRALWRAEAVDGELVRLEGGRTRAELVELLIAEADRDPKLIVGVDFAFSLPAWYLQERQLTPRQLWVLVADEALIPTMRQLGLTRWMNRPSCRSGSQARRTHSSQQRDRLTARRKGPSACH
jgi:hypothetical protein